LITSPHNEKLKLVRKLGRRRSREQEGLFVTEGEDLLEAARAAGAEPVELLTAGGAGLGGTEVEPELLDNVSNLGSGTRAIGIWRQRWAESAGAPSVYLHAVSDPGNVGTVIRTAAALVGGTVVIGPDCADPFGPRAVRASMGSVFSLPLVRGGVELTPEPRAAMVAHGGDPLERLTGAATLCLGAEREGLPEQVLAQCDATVTIPLLGGAESLNVAAAAAIALQRISSPASGDDLPDDSPDEVQA
jgi:TrmH family RNA methyltransferase